MAWPDNIDVLLLTLGTAFAVLLVTLDAALPLRLPAGLVATLVLPGYAVSLIAFPRGELDVVDRAGLSFSLSLAAIVVVALAASVLPGGLTMTTLVGAVCAVTLAAAALATLRRRRIAGTPAVPLATLRDARLWRQSSRRGAVAGLAAGAVVLIALLAVTIATPPPPATEFFVLGPDGTVDSLPARVATGAPTAVTIRISHDDGSGEQYRVVVESNAVQLASLGPLTVARGGEWTGQLVFRLPTPGIAQEVRVLLFKGSSAVPFRSLRLEIDVGSSS